MEESQKDLQSAMQSISIAEKKKTKSSSFLDIVGADVDSSFKEPMSYAVSSSVAEISIAGEDVKSGNCAISIRDQGVLLNVSRSCIAFDIILSVNNLPPDNALAIFEPINCQIGSLSWATGDCAQLCQMLTYSKSKKHYKKSATGMMLNTKQSSYNSTLSGLPFHVLAGNVTNELSNLLTEFYVTSKMEFSEFKLVAPNTYRCVIPLNELFPWLKESFPENVIPLMMGEQLTGNAEIQPVDRFLNKVVGSTSIPDFTIRNAELIKVYTQLDAPRVADLIKSSVTFLKHDYLLVTQPLGQSVTLNYNVSEKSRLKKLYISTFWNRNSAMYARVPTIAGNESNLAFIDDGDAVGTISSFKNPTTYFPAFSRLISMMQFSFSGITRTFNLQQLSVLFDAGVITGEESFYEDEPIGKATKSVLCIDLERMAKDFWGSSSPAGSQTQMQVTINFNFGSAYVLPGVTYDGVNSTSLFVVKTYLEHAQEAHCENGIFKKHMTSYHDVTERLDDEILSLQSQLDLADKIKALLFDQPDYESQEILKQIKGEVTSSLKQIYRSGYSIVDQISRRAAKTEKALTIESDAVIQSKEFTSGEYLTSDLFDEDRGEQQSRNMERQRTAEVTGIVNDNVSKIELKDLLKNKQFRYLYEIAYRLRMKQKFGHPAKQQEIQHDPIQNIIDDDPVVDPDEEIKEDQSPFQYVQYDDDDFMILAGGKFKHIMDGHKLVIGKKNKRKIASNNIKSRKQFLELTEEVFEVEDSNDVEKSSFMKYIFEHSTKIKRKTNFNEIMIQYLAEHIKAQEPFDSPLDIVEPDLPIPKPEE